MEVMEANRGTPLGASSAPNNADPIEVVLAHRRLNLEGLDARIGLHKGAFVSCTAAIGHMIAEMARVRGQHAIVLISVGSSYRSSRERLRNCVEKPCRPDRRDARRRLHDNAFPAFPRTSLARLHPCRARPRLESDVQIPLA